MSVSVTAKINISTTATVSNPSALGNFNGQPTISYANNLNSSQIAYCYQAALTPTTTLAIDLANGSINDPFGNPLTFTHVYNWIIQNNGTTTLTVGGGTHPLMVSDSQTIQPGITVSNPNVYPVTSGSHDTLTIALSGSTSSFSIIILGD